MSEKSYHSDCAICKNYKEFEMPSWKRQKKES